MRIAMLSYHTCPLATLGGKDTGGMNVYVQQLTRHLGLKGVHVDVFTRSQDEHIPQVLHDLGYGNRVVHIPAGPEVPLSKPELAQYLGEFEKGIKFFAAKKGLKYDLIHSHYWMSGIAAKALKKDWNVPILHMFHTLGKMKNSIAQSEAEIEGDYRINGEMEVLRAADGLVVATQAEKDQLKTLYGIKDLPMAIIPPGVDTAHFYPIPKDEAKEVINVPENDRMILFVGRIERLKGIDTLLQAISILSKNGALKCCNYFLVIIGGNPEYEGNGNEGELSRLMKMCEEIGIGDLVLFLGNRSQDTLPYYYSAAECVVMPSHYESFGMVALEAMACGTPVIASQVGGLAYLVQDGETGYSIPNGNPEILSQKLLEIIRNSKLRKRLGDGAAAYAKNYDWNRISTCIVNSYKTLLNEGGVETPCLKID